MKVIRKASSCSANETKPIIKSFANSFGLIFQNCLFNGSPQHTRTYTISLSLSHIHKHTHTLSLSQTHTHFLSLLPWYCWVDLLKSATSEIVYWKKGGKERDEEKTFQIGFKVIRLALCGLKPNATAIGFGPTPSFKPAPSALPPSPTNNEWDAASLLLPHLSSRLSLSLSLYLEIKTWNEVFKNKHTYARSRSRHLSKCVCVWERERERLACIITRPK